MVERLVPPEIEAAREYIDTFVAREVICPPLAATMKPYRDENTGDVDWEALSKKVELISYFNDPINDTLSGKLANQYVRYLSFAFHDPEEAPYTKVWILPDFSSNAHYDKFLEQTKLKIRDSLLSTKANRKLVQDVYEQEMVRQPALAQMRNVVNQILKEDQNIDAVDLMLLVVVEKIFTGAYIYGEPLSNKDLEGFPTKRGDIQQFKYSHFGTHYMWQAVSPFADNIPLMGEGSVPKRQALESLNTQRGLIVNLDEHIERIRSIRDRRVT